MQKLTATEILGIIVTIIGVSLGSLFLYQQNQINHQALQLNQQLQQAQSYLDKQGIKVKTTVKDSAAMVAEKKDRKNHEKVVSAINKMFQKFYTYQSGNEYLARKKKLKNKLAPELLNDEALFPTKDYLVAQIKNQKLTGEYTDGEIQTGIMNGRIIPFAAKISYKMTKGNKYSATASDEYSGRYDLRSQKFTRLKRIGRVDSTFSKNFNANDD